MNCHGNNKEKQRKHSHSPLKHMLHMIICCGLPIVIIGLLPVITKLSPSAANVVGKIAPFLCPIMMVFMVVMMMSGKKGSCCDSKESKVSNKEIV